MSFVCNSPVKDSKIKFSPNCDSVMRLTVCQPIKERQSLLVALQNMSSLF